MTLANEKRAKRIEAAHNEKDWELLKQAYITAAEERKDWGLPPFIGSPQIKY